MRRVILESPYKGEVGRNVRYARECLLDCLHRGDAPIASHLLYPQVLDDNKRDERLLGIEAGIVWVQVAEAMVIYMDLGISDGMAQAIKFAEALAIPVEYRNLKDAKSAKIEAAE